MRISHVQSLKQKIFKKRRRDRGRENGKVFLCIFQKESIEVKCDAAFVVYRW